MALLALALPALPAAAERAAAQSAAGFVAERSAPSGPSAWTPRQLLNAAPLDPAPSAGFAARPLAAVPSAPAAGGPAWAPSVSIAPQPDYLVHAPIDLESLRQPAPTRDTAAGTGVFSESRVIPLDAVNTYPFVAAGKLFFRDPRTLQHFVCSASVNSLRAILTAGHCVAHGSPIAGRRYFYDDFRFVPAFRNGAAPFGQWTTTGYKLVSNSWWFSGNVPNARDFALLEAADLGGKTLGSVVGGFGWQTFRLSRNQFTTLGYPCNLDNCMLMQRNDAATAAFGGNNTWVVGSNMDGGAGGGPWVQDFGVNPAGAPPVPLGGNIVVGVTSYVPISGVGFIGASQFDQVFINMRNAFCAHQSGNC